MSNFFSSAPASSMPFVPEDSLLSRPPPPPQEVHPQSLGNTTTSNNIHEYSNQAPSYPQYDTRDAHLSLSKHGSTPQQSEIIPQHSNQIPSVAMVSSTVDNNHHAEDFHPYNPAQKPEARANRGPPKQITPAQSPEGKLSSNGRRRTRTKVVAWDPNDLETIYKRKEIDREDWDTICRVRFLLHRMLANHTYSFIQGLSESD
ncbi:MAG: hypothetical protein Q9166_002495 [cf. Caloplaca sp. 2 TL-2023]